MKKKFNFPGIRYNNRIISVFVFFSFFLFGCQHSDKRDDLSAIVDQQTVRKIKVLSEDWKFQLDIRNIGEKEQWYAKDVSDWGSVQVPMAWDCYEDALWGYEGIGWYAITISPDDFIAGKKNEIIFGRIMYYSKVWLNGEFIGENIGGYLPFSFDIGKYLNTRQENKLVVRVDNRYRIEWFPFAAQVEWMQYGGILEPVKLVSKSPTYIEDLIVRTIPKDGGAEISCLISLSNETEISSDVELNVEIEGTTGFLNKKLEVHFGSNDTTEVTVGFTLERAELWSPDTPVLYTVRVNVVNEGIIVDDFTDDFGIRQISVEGTSIILNGEPIIIKGVNRYDDYNRFGPNVPEKLLREELELMKKVGINTIRVHYPQSPHLLSLYDEYGFMMIEEVPINWWRAESLDILFQAKSFLSKMISRDKNHPCVIIWSMANESSTDTEIGATVMRELLKLAKFIDPSRLVSFVVNTDPKIHPAFNESDIICCNMYPGSLQDPICDHISEIDSLGYKSLVKNLTLYSSYYANKPIVITEYGALGFKNINGDVYSTEEFQAAYIEQIWDGIISVPGVSGGVLWSWADYYHRNHYITYSAYGPYGVVTGDRKHKKSLESLARMYGGSIQYNPLHFIE